MRDRERKKIPLSKVISQKKRKEVRFRHVAQLLLIGGKPLRKPINGLYRFEWLVVINLLRLDKNGSIKAIRNNKFDKNDTINMT